MQGQYERNTTCDNSFKVVVINCVKLVREFKRRYIKYNLALWNCWLQLIPPIYYLIYSEERCKQMELEALEFVKEFIEKQKKKINKC